MLFFSDLSTFATLVAVGGLVSTWRKHFFCSSEFKLWSMGGERRKSVLKCQPQFSRFYFVSWMVVLGLRRFSAGLNLQFPVSLASLDNLLVFPFASTSSSSSFLARKKIGFRSRIQFAQMIVVFFLSRETFLREVAFFYQLEGLSGNPNSFFMIATPMFAALCSDSWSCFHLLPAVRLAGLL